MGNGMWKEFGGSSRMRMKVRVMGYVYEWFIRQLERRNGNGGTVL
jgi:hypothetical protein